MPFRLKIGIAFGAILLLTVIVAFTSIYGMRHAIVHQKNLYGFTHDLEIHFQEIIYAEVLFVANGEIKHSRDVFKLINKIKTDIKSVSASIYVPEQIERIQNLLSAVARYEKSFEKVAKSKVDMETMKSRMLHESSRLIKNADAIKTKDAGAFQILKIVNDTLLEEKNFIVSGKEKDALKVLEYSNLINQLALVIKDSAQEDTTRLYAYRIANIAKMYETIFRKFMDSFELQKQSITDLHTVSKDFKSELNEYIHFVSKKEERFSSFLQKSILFVSLIVILLGVLATFILSKRITAPINNLKETAAHIHSGNLNIRVNVTSQDEIGDLGNIFNEMTQRLENGFNSLATYRDRLEDMVKDRTLKMEEEIEQHKKTQMALRKEKDRAFQYFDITASILLVLNTDGTVALVNKAGSRILGDPKEKIIGKNWFDTYLFEDDRKEILDVFSEIANPENEFFENYIMTRQGGKRLISWHNNVLRNPDGQTIATLCAGEDITQIRQMEYEKKLLQERLQRSQKLESIGTLAGGIAHDFNNILYPIIGFTEITMGQLPKDHAVQGNLSSVLQGAIRAKELVEQILSFSRQKQKTKKTTKIQPIISEALKLLRSTIPRNIEIRRDISIDARPILGDPTEIYEIIMNLCTNAYHAMEESGGTLTIKLTETQIGNEDEKRLDICTGDYCVLSVHDTGKGIPRNILEKIFDPYFTTKKMGKGSGLGLAVIHGIVKDYNGTVIVQSEIKTGTTFLIYLPISENQDCFVSEKKRSQKMIGNEHILLVDDEEAIVDIGIQILENLGYRVTGETSSQDAFQTFALEPDKFDIVVTDMSMPGMTGTKLAKKIKEVRPDIPIIICSGYSLEIDAEKAEAFGIQGFLNKPVLGNDLSIKIREILDKITAERKEKEKIKYTGEPKDKM